MVAFAALLAVLVAVVIRQNSITDWVHRAITRHDQAELLSE